MSSGRSSTGSIHALSIRKPYRKNYANALRFMHSMPSHVIDLMVTWIKMPKGPVPSSYLHSDDYNGIDGDSKRTVESELQEACRKLTKIQRTV